MLFFYPVRIAHTHTHTQREKKTEVQKKIHVKLPQRSQTSNKVVQQQQQIVMLVFLFV